MGLFESVKRNLKESVGYNLEQTINECTYYYVSNTGSSVKSEQRAHTTGGGLSHSNYVKILFDDGTSMLFFDSYSRIKLGISSGGSMYEFDVYESDYKEKIQEFITTGHVEGSYKVNSHYMDDTFTKQTVIDNKGNLVLKMERDGTNKEEILDKINTLPDDFPVIQVSGLWNTMNDGHLMTLKELRDYIDKYHVHYYGGRDDLELYDNLLYAKDC